MARRSCHQIGAQIQSRRASDAVWLDAQRHYALGRFGRFGRFGRYGRYGRYDGICHSVDFPLHTLCAKPGVFGFAVVLTTISRSERASRHQAPPLLHRHTLRQIPRLVYIGAACASRVIRQQLQRHDVQDG